LVPQQQAVAEDALAVYRFGEGLTVVGVEAWKMDTFDGRNDWTRLLYVTDASDGAHADLHKVSFHAAFKEGTATLVEAYAYWMESGSEIGSPGVHQARPTHGLPKDQEIEAALLALLRLTEGGLENARKVVSRVMNDTEAARLIAAASWGTQGGAVVNGSRAWVEGRNQRITVRVGETTTTLTPCEWVRRVRRMLTPPTPSEAYVLLDPSYSKDEDSISPSAGTR